MLKCGRKPITKQERELVVDTYKEYLVGATMIEKILTGKGICISHNRIYRILVEEGLAKQQKNRQKTRKYKACERKHSLSLTHTDWAGYKGDFV